MQFYAEGKNVHPLKQKASVVQRLNNSQRYIFVQQIEVPQKAEPEPSEDLERLIVATMRRGN